MTLDCFRVVRKTWAPPANRTQAYYDVTLELAPIGPGQPSGAFNRNVYGVKPSMPILPTPTTPGNVLLMAMMSGAATGRHVAYFSMEDNPNYPPEDGGSYPIPPFPDQAGWTVLGTDWTDVASMNIMGPGDGVFGNNPPGLRVGWAWRYVQPGEVTDHPVAVSTDEAHNGVAAYLWELSSSAVPSWIGSFGQIHKSGTTSHWDFGSQTGNIYGLVGFEQADYGSGPVAVTPDSGVTTIQSNDNYNNPACSGTGWPPYVYIGQMPTGGTLGVTFQAIAAYTSLNACGAMISLPAGVTLSTIPYPSNQVTGS